MVTDQEPRYRLVDADGNVVGSLFAEADGTLKLQEGTSGGDNELSLTPQGALEAEQVTVAGKIGNPVSADSGNQINFDRVTVADGATEPLSLSGGSGVSISFIVGVSSGDSAIFSTRGGFDVAVEIADPQGSYSSSLGTTSSTNIDYDGSEYVIENQTGSSNDYDIFEFS